MEREINRNEIKKQTPYKIILSHIRDKHGERVVEYLRHFFEKLPKRVNTKKEKSEPPMLMYKAYAISSRYIQVNTENAYHYLVLDNDNNDPMFWKDINIPAPTYIVINPENYHSHLFYELEKPIRKDNAKATKYLRDVLRGLCRRAGCDETPTHIIARNPFSIHHNLYPYSKVYLLDELNDYLTQKDKRIDYSKFSRKLELETIKVGNRNLTFFSLTSREIWLRLRCGRIKDAEIMDESLSMLQELNKTIVSNHIEPLPETELKSIAKSITRMHKGKVPLSPMWEANLLNDLMTKKERQHEGSLFTAKNKRRKSDDLIIKAMNIIHEREEKITYEAIRLESNLSIETVKRREALIKEYKKTMIG